MITTWFSFPISFAEIICQLEEGKQNNYRATRECDFLLGIIRPRLFSQISLIGNRVFHGNWVFLVGSSLEKGYYTIYIRPNLQYNTYHAVKSSPRFKMYCCKGCV